MQLFHLNWEKSSSRNADEHLKIVMPGRSEDHSFIRKLFDDGELYELVATSDLDDAEKVYTATQNGILSDSWSINPPTAISPIEPSSHNGRNGEKHGRRSTSVGDIIVKDDKVLFCATMGFQEI